MRMLTKEQFAKARNFMLHQARDIEKAMYQYEYEMGRTVAVLEYQVNSIMME
jgi:hypothetical protein